jgi:cardiolipin synthase
LRFERFHRMLGGMNPPSEAACEWLETGGEMLSRMLTALAEARESVRLEMYIIHAGVTGEQFRDALVAACRRGARVQVLVDAVGSMVLPASFWEKLRAAGGQFRWFNPLSWSGWSIRDHRKLLVCDGRLAFVGGVNIAAEYQGDGVKAGWRDLGLAVRGPLAGELSAAFDQMFACADFRHPPFARLRASPRQKIVVAPDALLLLGGPSRNNPIKLSLRRDLMRARSVRIICAYFLPPWRIRRELGRAARRGARVQLILPGRSDLPFSRLAGRTFYRRLLAAGVEIYEYQPQILHAKMFLMDDIVYAGSANLDRRALGINYELMLRLSHPDLARQGGEIFERVLAHCRRIHLQDWRQARTLMERCQSRLAYFLLARLDPIVARWQWRWRGAEKEQP